jgi:uncharacterized protein YjgD (DUF1641 family)
MDTTGVPELSPWQAMKELRSPEMRRGLGFLVTFLKDIAHTDQPLAPKEA